jgi:hypothetical protein
MRLLLVALLLLSFVCGTEGQEPGRGYDPKTSYSVFAEYSNDSSHIIIGKSENRRLFAAGLDYNRRLGDRSIFTWRYQVEVIPLMLLQNPKLTTTLTNTAIGDPASAGFPVGTFQVSELQLRQCTSRSASGTYFEAGEDGQPIPVGTYTFTADCTNPWTYGGGVSPLGQKVNFLPLSRLQPYAAFNAGFAAFAKTVPSDNATMFNFTFEFGGGVEWNVRPGKALAIDYRYHHISNAGRGEENPGVDNGTFRLAYSFWR